MANQHSAAPRIKGVADVVFVLDVSGSMADIIEGVKRHIGDFVAKLLGDPQSTLRDVRLGLVTHDVDGDAKVHAASFVTSAEGFRSNLLAAPSGVDEYGLPAIDRALDSPWRSVCRRYIVFLTDEPVSSGHAPQFQESKVYPLCEKMTRLHVHFIGYGPPCPNYELVGKTPGSMYRVVDRGELEALDMRDVLVGIARTITMGSDQQLGGGARANLYGL